MTDLDKLTRPALNVLVRQALADAQRQSSRADANLRDLNSASEERDAALARIAKVEAVHQRVGAPWPHIGGVYVCRADNSVWPCPTVRALTEGENE
ncbi:hypothetical protein [Leucobacter sp. G161]|uniref:hypothetical protein n=1 Tax=Leucobacter sp. G161 TaxID=663704 RepID=UPI00073E5DC5|nr:hypothetical protein [Leucobacter sp. G161]